VTGAIAGLLVVVVVVGGLVWSAASGRPAAAQRPALFAGSLVLADSRPLPVLDVATGQVNVRLGGVNAQVGATNDGDVQPVALSGGTMLVNRVSGSFNYLDPDDYVVDPSGPGVGLGRLDGIRGAEGLASGSDAYIVRSAPTSTVSLVGRQTVAQAARAQGRSAAVTPLGFSSLGGQVDLQPGSAAVSGTDLWVLVDRAAGCRAVQLNPVLLSRQGLEATDRSSTAAPCRLAALESQGASVALATPGQVEVMAASPDARRRPAAVKVATPFTTGASRLLPVTGATGQMWFLAGTGRGWTLFGVSPLGGTTGPFPLGGFGPQADPAAPVLSAGFLYTLDRAQSGRPTLWTIDVANGRMAPLDGVAAYPVLDPSEKATFSGAQVLVDGPRVVFNNPQSLDAVLVFTDTDRPPVVLDKSQAVTVSATGPADLNLTKPAKPGAKGGSPAGAVKPVVPALQPVNPQVTCANTTQKPYVPQITGINPSSGAALVQWSYELLDQTDCEPSSWAVAVRALTGGHQPDIPVQVVYGQDQYLFTGLRPATTYQVDVTAYINHQSTPSTPATFTTSARGPDAPLSVQSRADGHGAWVVSWTPCSESSNQNCVVPAAQWTVIGAACSGGFVGAPPSIQVAGTQDTATINAANLGLLGDSLSFSVQGSLPSGLTGNPTSDRSCTEAWQPPTAASISLGSRNPQAEPDGTISVTLAIAVNGDAPTVLGSRQTYYVSRVGGKIVGPTQQTQVTISGLPANVPLTPTVTVFPAGHPDASVTLAGQTFSRLRPWPADLQTGTAAAGQVDPSNPNSGTVTVTLPADLPAVPLEAITPDPATGTGGGPVLQCGGAGGAPGQFPVQAVNGRTRQLTFALAPGGPDGDLVNTGGSCQISFSLVDPQNPDPFGAPSQQIKAAFTIGNPPSYSYTTQFVGDCTADFKCGPLGEPYQLAVDSGAPFAGGDNWSVTGGDPRVAPALDPCFTGTLGLPTPPVFPFIVTLPQACADPQDVQMTVTYTYLGQQVKVDAGYPTNSPGSPATTTTTTSSTTSTTTSDSSTTTTAGTTPASAASVGAGNLAWWAAGAGVAGAVGLYSRRKSRKRSS
jgi:hypothetical protein